PVFFSILRRSPTSTLFPYTTLFRSIASSNKESGKAATSVTFAMTPEAKLLADSFSSNKGRLIWPVEKGIKSQGYGVYADKLYPGDRKSTRLNSSHVKISYAVFCLKK